MVKVTESKDKEIVVFQKEVGSIVEEAKGLVIKDVKTLEKGNEVLSQLNRFMDKVKAEKESITRPAQDILNRERARWKPIETVCDEGISIMRKRMSDYQTEQIRKQREEEAKIAARVGEGKGKLKIETAVKKIDAIDRTPKSVATMSGSLSFREDKVLKIIDIDKIPKRFWIVDESQLLTALKAGEKVPGAEIEIIQTPVNRR